MNQKSLSPAKPAAEVITIEVVEGFVEVVNKTGLAKQILLNSAASALTSGLVEMSKEGNERLDDLEDGKISGKEFTVRVLERGVRSATTTSVKTATALSLREGAIIIGKRFGKDITRRLGVSTVTALAFGMVEQATDTYRWMQGQLTERDYKVNTVSNVGSMGGTAAGAMLGSAIPGAGTMVGMLIGSMIGNYYGGILGRNLGEEYFKEDAKEDETPSASGEQDAS